GREPGAAGLAEVGIAPARATGSRARGVPLAVLLLARPQVAPGEADEHGGAAGPGALALERPPDGPDGVAPRARRRVRHPLRQRRLPRPCVLRPSPFALRQIRPFACASS